MFTESDILKRNNEEIDKEIEEIGCIGDIDSRLTEDELKLKKRLTEEMHKISTDDFIRETNKVFREWIVKRMEKDLSRLTDEP